MQTAYHTFIEEESCKYKTTITCCEQRTASLHNRVVQRQPTTTTQLQSKRACREPKTSPRLNQRRSHQRAAASAKHPLSTHHPLLMPKKRWQEDGRTRFDSRKASSWNHQQRSYIAPEKNDHGQRQTPEERNIRHPYHISGTMLPTEGRR